MSLREGGRAKEIERDKGREGGRAKEMETNRGREGETN